LRTGSGFSQEYVIDRPVVDIADFSHLNIVDGSGNAGRWNGTGTAELTHINSSEVAGLRLASNNDSFGVLWTLPVDIDTDKQIDFRVIWSNSEAAGTGSLTLTGAYTALTLGTTAVAVGGTAFDTTWDGQADLAANVIRATGWGSIDAGTSAIQSLEGGDDLIALHVKGTLTTISNADIYKVQARYYRKWLA
jgi:hypothetical protein